MGHAGGGSVEGGLGVLGALETGEGEVEDGHGAVGKLSEDQLLTDTDQAVDFVERTKVDALAIAMGTSHGAYKFSRKPDGDILAMHVIEEINRRLPNIHLVMHGSSSVPQELQDIFNAYGGEMPQHGACLWPRMSAGSSMVCAKSISALIAGLPCWG